MHTGEWIIQTDQLGGLFIARRRNGGHDVIKSMEVEFVEEGHRAPDPLTTHFFGGDATAFLQAAMDAAYEMGLRPSRGQDERHMVTHLNDMRKIAFHALGIERANGG